MKTITLTQELYEELLSLIEYQDKQMELEKIEDEGLEDYANDKLWSSMMKAIRIAE